MNKIVTLLFSLLLLNGGTELHQLWKLPLLAKHYTQHCRENPGMSLFKFLKIHYSDGKHPNDNDDNEDNKLPFKSAGNITHIDIPIIVNQDIPVPALLPENPFTASLHDEGILCNRAFSVFHPPRMA
jgi:hypothetical protein